MRDRLWTDQSFSLQEIAKTELRRRGYTPELQDRWGIGLDDGSVFVPPGGEWKDVGLMDKDGRQVHEGRLVFPIRDWTGLLVGFSSRRLLGDGPKWLVSAESPGFSRSMHVFNLDRAAPVIRRRDFAVVVEGVCDALTLEAAGIGNVVQLLGTIVSRRQVDLLRRHCKRVVLMLDPDTAGRAAVAAMSPVFSIVGLDVCVANLEGGDPDEVVRSNGVAAVVTAIKAAVKG